MILFLLVMRCCLSWCHFLFVCLFSLFRLSLSFYLVLPLSLCAPSKSGNVEAKKKEGAPFLSFVVLRSQLRDFITHTLFLCPLFLSLSLCVPPFCFSLFFFHLIRSIQEEEFLHRSLNYNRCHRLKLYDVLWTS